MSKLSQCRRCDLWKTRKNVVIGRGNKRASILFVGEAPGKNEDEQGEPFVGSAGSWFDKIIDFLKLDEDDYYLTNVLKCRPHISRDNGTTKNRKPEVVEIQACLPWLNAQIRKINPELIILMGDVVLSAVLGFSGIIKNGHRGRAYYEGNTIYFVLCHPAILVYNKKDQLAEYKKDLKALKDLIRKVGIDV